MVRPKIFITRRLPNIAKELLKEHFDVYENDKNEAFPAEKLSEIISEYDGVLSSITDKFTKEVLKKKNKLKVISNYAVGLDNIDLETANYLGIKVYNTPDVVTNSTADLTFALLLSFIRNVRLADDFVKQGKWKTWDPELLLGEEPHGKKFGIIGFGRIGKAVAKRALGFGLDVIFYDKNVINDKTIIAKQVDLDILLRESDYISIHVSLNDKTKDMINMSLMKKMLKKPILLNLSRGLVVNTNDLVIALEKGLIKGACLDVTDPEPLAGNHPLCKFDNCIISPHIGTATKECRYNMARLAAQNIINHFNDNC